MNCMKKLEHARENLEQYQKLYEWLRENHEDILRKGLHEIQS